MPSVDLNFVVAVIRQHHRPRGTCAYRYLAKRNHRRTGGEGSACLTFPLQLHPKAGVGSVAAEINPSSAPARCRRRKSDVQRNALSRRHRERNAYIGRAEDVPQNLHRGHGHLGGSTVFEHNELRLGLSQLNVAKVQSRRRSDQLLRCGCCLTP